VADIPGALRVPDAARAYRGIRANMEQTSLCIGLDRYGRGCLGGGREGPRPSSAKVRQADMAVRVIGQYSGRLCRDTGTCLQAIAGGAIIRPLPDVRRSYYTRVCDSDTSP
jgi:hypothetical protein